MAESFTTVKEVYKWLRRQSKSIGIDIREIDPEDSWGAPLICLDDVLGILMSDKTTRPAEYGVNLLFHLITTKKVKLHWPNPRDNTAYLVMCQPYNCVEILLRYPFRSFSQDDYPVYMAFMSRFTPQMKMVVCQSWLKKQYELPDC